MSSIVKENGNTRILMGPFNSKAEAEAKQTLLNEKMARAKKSDTVSEIIEHKAAQ